jgi:hypothetical protein
MSSSESTQRLLCNQGLREQIEILWRHQNLHEVLDLTFVKSHAQSIVQLSEELSYIEARDAPAHRK